jgi:DNA-binding response OmpR family regulator
MIRRILLCHESRAIRTQLKRQLMGEVSDVEVSEAADVDQARKAVTEHTFAVVAADLGPGDQDGLALFRFMRQRSSEDTPPFLMLVNEDEAKERAQELSSEGVHHLHVISDGSERLVAHINEICSPRRMRAFPRVHITDTTARLHLAQSRVKAEVINISLNGALLEFFISPSATAERAALFDLNTVDVHFPGDLGTVEDIPVLVLRVDVLSSRLGSPPLTVRAAMKFPDVPMAVVEQLKRVFDEVKEPGA